MHVQVLNDPLKLGPTQLWVDGKATTGEEGAGGHTWGSGGCQGARAGQVVGPGMGRRGGRAGVVQAGPSWLGLTEAGFVAFVVLPKGHQPDGDGLQERPDGGRELWREASVSSTTQKKDQGHARARGRCRHSADFY